MKDYVGVLLVDGKNQIYLIKENDINDIGKDRWNLPGGSVDEGEGILEAAKREVLEETGYLTEIRSLLGCYKASKGGRSWFYLVLEARVIVAQEKPTDPDVKEGRWFSREDFLNLENSEIVHPDMKLVYDVAVTGRGLPAETIKLINYDE